MANCDFYAAAADLNKVLEFVFSECECQVFETYSQFDKELMEFRSVDEISQWYSLGMCKGGSPSVLLSLVPPCERDLISMRRIELKPGAVPDATYRYSLEGWGTISLQLGGVGAKGLVHSHTNHNSEERARAWSATYPDWRAVDEWNWAEITRISNRLNRHISKHLAVSKIGSRPILAEALHLLNNGMRAI